MSPGVRLHMDRASPELKDTIPIEYQLCILHKDQQSIQYQCRPDCYYQIKQNEICRMRYRSSLGLNLISLVYKSQFTMNALATALEEKVIHSLMLDKGENPQWKTLSLQLQA